MDELPGSSLLGLGFDIRGRYTTSSSRQRVLRPLVIGGREFTSGPNVYRLPDGVTVTHGDGGDMTAGKAFVFQSERDYQSYFAARAGVSGSYAGFSGEVAAAYDHGMMSQQSSWLAVIEGRNSAFVASIDSLSPSDDFLKDPDVAALTSLSNPIFDPADPGLYYRVIATWGTHVIQSVTMGGSLRYQATVQRSASADDTKISANLSLEYKAVVGDAAGVQASADWKTLTTEWASSRHVSIAAIGGNDQLLNALDPAYGDNVNSAYVQWLQGLEAEPGVIDFTLRPLSAVFKGALADAVADAITAFTQTGIYVEAAFDLKPPASARGVIEVSGHRVAAATGDPMAGAGQFVVVDATTMQVKTNNTVYAKDHPSVEDFWSHLMSGVDSSQPNLLCALVTYALKLGYYPTSAAALQLADFGATLQGWEEAKVLNPGAPGAYALIGGTGLAPGRALEFVDWVRGSSPSAYASAMTPLYRDHRGTYSLPGILSGAL